MKFETGDRIRLRSKPSRTGRFFRESRAKAYEVIVIWDDTRRLSFVDIGDIERCENGCG